VPHTPESWFNAGVAAISQSNYTNAEFCFRQALLLAPNSLETQLNLGYVLSAQGRNEEALHCYESVLAVFPDCAEAHFNRAAHLLRKGDYTNGFADYEYRLVSKKEIDIRTYTQPLWDGAPLNGRTLLVYCEQGLGDSIMFARFIPLLAKFDGRVVLEVQQPLVSLMASLQGVERVIEKTSSLPTTDYYVRLLSLPHLLGTTVDSLPCQTPYLAASSQRLAAWQEKLGKTGDNFRIGLVWAGKEMPYPNRSCPPAFLTPLLTVAGINIFSLQIGDKERFPLPELFSEKIIDLTADIRDFDDTSALITNLDLVITIDSAVAHLAGALGKPTWLMLPCAADWRWMSDRSDSPWYPTMRLFRQPTAGDWQSVVAEVVQALQKQVPRSVADLPKREPLDIQTCYDLGVRLKESGDYVGAEKCFRRIVSQAPELPDPQYALGVVLQLLGRVQESITYYQAATTLDPLFAKAHYNLADALSLCGLYQDALKSVRTAIHCDPTYADAHWLFGMLLLRQGNLPDGWREYEWRWKSKRFTSRIPALGRPLWDGSPLDGRTLLIHMEQGRGDMIQFVRYAPLATATGGRVIVCALPELVSLLSSIEGVCQSVDRNGPLPEFDVHIPVLSLPFLFKTTSETIPNTTPYIHPDPIKVAGWRGKTSSNTHLKVALTWAGQEYPDPKRSIPFNECLSLFSLSELDIYSLQFGKGAEELSSLPPEGTVHDYTKQVSDFSDTAALIANLDLVISVDTAVAHLAGAMGKPVWLLLPFVSDWRWQLDRSDSLWYPTMKIFRQSTAGDWAGVVDRVKEELTQLNSGGAGFYFQRGAELLRQGFAADAEKVFLKALSLDPNNAEVLCNLGVAQDAQHKYEEALARYRTAITLRPDYMQAFFNMGNSCRSFGNPAAAISCYEQTLALAPDFVPALLCLGELCKEQGYYIRAEECFAAAIALDQHNVYAWQGLGDSQHGQENFAGAIHSYHKALALEPRRASTFNRMGLSYHLAGQFNNAEDCFREALLLAPEDPALLNNIGILFHSQDRIDEEIRVYHRLLTHDPTFAEGHWNLSLALLTKGEFLEGWREYEWRLKKNKPTSRRDCPQPRWDGSPLEGKTILLHCEQGFGDTIQFARYALLVAELGGTVVIECQSVLLKRLLSSLTGIEIIVSGDPLPHFDCHLPLLSLPFVFNTSVESIPASVPYLYPDQSDVDTWRLRLDPPKAFRIGIVWFARQDQILNRKRSCPLAAFTPLLAVPNCEFYNLQIGVGIEQLSECTFGQQVADFTAELHDFADTAALIKNFDLVISIDTAVAHLAGAMGVTTWTLLPFGAEWRWLQQRADSPWYPTMRLFRQPASGDWHTVMQEVREALFCRLQNEHKQSAADVIFS